MSLSKIHPDELCDPPVTLVSINKNLNWINDWNISIYVIVLVWYVSSSFNTKSNSRWKGFGKIPRIHRRIWSRRCLIKNAQKILNLSIYSNYTSDIDSWVLFLNRIFFYLPFFFKKSFDTDWNCSYWFLIYALNIHEYYISIYYFSAKRVDLNI